jgi:hypothetical protein
VRVDSSAILSSSSFDLEIGFGIDLVALDNVVRCHLVTGIGINLLIANALAGLAVNLIETDFVGFRGRREQRYRARHQRQS